jgi:hydroxyethylthiazole kinase-like sugar kinase family protein
MLIFFIGHHLPSVDFVKESTDAARASYGGQEWLANMHGTGCLEGQTLYLVYQILFNFAS